MNTKRAAAPKVTFGKFSHALRVSELYNGEKRVYLDGEQVGTIERLATVRRGGNASTDTIQVDGYTVDLWANGSEPTSATFPTLAEAAAYCRATLTRKA